MTHLKTLLGVAAFACCAMVVNAKTYPVSITFNTPEVMSHTERDDDKSYVGYAYRTDVKVKSTSYHYKGRLTCSVPRKENVSVTVEAYFVVRESGSKERVDGSILVGTYEFGGNNPQTQIIEFDTPVLQEEKTRDSYVGYRGSGIYSSSSGMRHVGVIVRAIEDGKVAKVYTYPSNSSWAAAGKKDVVTFEKTTTARPRNSSFGSAKIGRAGATVGSVAEPCVTVRIDGTGPSTPAGWMDDFFAAQDVAAKENKLLLVVFTGSDWCAPCKRLTDTVLKTVKFQDEAKKGYVLVFIDSPNDKSLLSETCRSQNPEISRMLSVNSGVPDVYIVSAEGEKLLRLGSAAHLENGVTSYLKFFTAADSGFRMIRTVYAKYKDGPKNAPERLQALLEVLKQIDPAILMECFRSEVEKLVAANPQFGNEFPQFQLFVPLEKEFMNLNSELSSEAYTLARSRSASGSVSSTEIKSCKRELMDSEYRARYRDLADRVTKNERSTIDTQTKNSLRKLRLDIFRVLNSQ